MLYVNVPDGVQQMAICFTDCTNRSNFTIMRRTAMNDDKLQVFSTEVSNTSNITYKIKLIFPDNSEGDSDWISHQRYVSDIRNDLLLDYEGSKEEIKNIFVLMCFTVMSLMILLLKIVIKIIRRKINE